MVLTHGVLYNNRYGLTWDDPTFMEVSSTFI